MPERYVYLMAKFGKLSIRPREFACQTDELAEMRFNGENPEFFYSRYANPAIVFLKKECTSLKRPKMTGPLSRA